MYVSESLRTQYKWLDCLGSHLTVKWGCVLSSFFMNFSKDLTGITFGRLKVLKESHRDEKNLSWYLCSCECGLEKIASRNRLIMGKTRSCGCLKREIKIIECTTHGKSKTRI